MHYDLSLNKIFTGTASGYILPGPVYNGELALAIPKENKLSLYSTADHRLEKVFEGIYTPDTPEVISQAVRIENWLLVRKQGSNDLEVYDNQTKKFLFRQRFDRALGELHPDPLTKTVCENTQGGLSRLWRIVGM